MRAMNTVAAFPCQSQESGFMWLASKRITIRDYLATYKNRIHYLSPAQTQGDLLTLECKREQDEGEGNFGTSLTRNWSLTESACSAILAPVDITLAIPV